MKTIALIDLGSNSVRMDVVRISEDHTYEYLLRTRKLIMLSEGMGEDMKLQRDPMDRAIDALTEFKILAKERQAGEILAVATAAVRNAQNGQAFCDEVHRETGISIHIISGEKEAEYDFEGVIGTLDIEDCVIVDTGGGSTEFILVIAGEPLARVSIPVGAVSLSEQFLIYGETEQSIAEAQDFVSSQIDKIPWLEDLDGVPVVGLGGSICTLGIVDRNRRESESDLHGYTLSYGRVEELYEEITDLTDEERISAGIEPGRVGTVVCGQMPVRALMRKISSDELVISTSTLREGLLYEILEQY